MLKAGVQTVGTMRLDHGEPKEMTLLLKGKKVVKEVRGKKVVLEGLKHKGDLLDYTNEEVNVFGWRDKKVQNYFLRGGVKCITR